MNLEDEACVKYHRKEVSLITLTELSVLLTTKGIRIVSKPGGLEVSDGHGVFTMVQTLENAIGAVLHIADLAEAKEREANDAFKAGAKERVEKGKTR